MLPSALERWREIAGRLDGRRPALFLDYDGTLAPIAPTPDAARMPEATRRVVRRLAAAMPVVVVSGRGRDDVERHVGVSGIAYAGSHGFDITGPGGERLELPALARRAGRPADTAGLRGAIDRAAGELARRLAAVPGALVEPKGYSVAVHYRRVAEAELPAVEAAVDDVVAAHPGLVETGGKKVFEIRPDLDWDKGRALVHLLAALDLDRPNVVALYLGDDLTDEDAFRALAGLSGGRGIGILVAEKPRPTAATYRLHDPDEVRQVLERLAERAESAATDR